MTSGTRVHGVGLTRQLAEAMPRAYADLRERWRARSSW